MNCIVPFLNEGLHSQSLQSNLVYDITNMHAMLYRSDFCTGSSRVNIEESVVCCIISLLLAFFRVGSPGWLIPPAMADSKSLITSLLEVMISSKNQHFIIRDLSDLTLPIIFDGW